MNESLLIRLRSILSSTRAEGSKFIAKLVLELKAKLPDYTGKVFKNGEQPSEDHMILSLLSQVVNAVTVSVGSKPEDSDKRERKLVEELEVHEKRLVERQLAVVEEIKVEEKEQKRFITTDDIHMGFETKTVRTILAICFLLDLHKSIREGLLTRFLFILDDGSCSSSSSCYHYKA